MHAWSLAKEQGRAIAPRALTQDNRHPLHYDKDVGLMDYGNPCLYSPTHLYTECFDTEDLVVIFILSANFHVIC
jgi:hypothetical protein